MDLLADLDARGLLHDSTDRDALAARLAEGPITVYYGCDPTADSLHHGNLIGLVMLRRFQDAGHTAIALAGGATGMVGDPSGRSEERNLLDDATLDHNVAAIKEQISRIVDVAGDRGRLVDNRGLDAARSRCSSSCATSASTPPSTRCWPGRACKVRLESEQGISFTEFSYMLLQANDYLWLHDHLGCELQIGGSDQFGNILSGVDLIRRKRQRAVHAMAWPLLTAADGSKLGKTLRRPAVARPRQDVAVPVPPALDAARRPAPRRAAEVLLAAPDRRARRAARGPRRGAGAAPRAAGAGRRGDGAGPRRGGGAGGGRGGRRSCSEAIPLGASLPALQTLAGEVPSSSSLERAGRWATPSTSSRRTGLASSKSDARRQLQQGAVRANGVAVGPDQGLDEVPLLHDRYLLLRKGKRSYHLVEISPGEG